jgi:hypothetical protein
MTPPVSKTLLMQRIRNGVIRYLEAASDPQVHTFLSSDALLNMWEDWIQEPLAQYAAPAFTEAESKALQRVHAAWLQLAEQTPDATTYDDLYAAQAWPEFVESCRDAYARFMQRGRLSEDVEVA